MEYDSDSKVLELVAQFDNEIDKRLPNYRKGPHYVQFDNQVVHAQYLPEPDHLKLWILVEPMVMCSVVLQAKDFYYL